MNKKIILAVILVIVVLGIAAFLMGFLNTESDSLGDSINVTLADSEMTYKGLEEDNGLQISSNSDNFSVEKQQPKVTVNYKGEIKIDLSNLTEKQIDQLKEKFNKSNSFEMFISFEEDNPTVEVTSFDYTINDNTLTLKFDFDDKYGSNSIKVGDSGKLTIKSGTIDFKTGDKPFNLHFK